MSQETTQAGKLGGLTRLSTALTAHAAEIPHLEGPHGRLAQILNEAVEVSKQQAALTASKLEATKRLQTLLTEGERVADGIRKFLKEHYGLRSEKLAQFGMQPFRGRRKASPDTEPPQPPDIEANRPSASPSK